MNIEAARNAMDTAVAEAETIEEVQAIVAEYSEVIGYHLGWLF